MRSETLSVNLVLHDFCRGWIIEKMAHKLCAALRDLGVDAVVSATPSADATVNHFMIFHYVDVAPGTLNTMAITHVDDALKVDMVRRHLAGGVRAAVCMSSMTVRQMIGFGVKRRQLTYALPAHDGAMPPRRIIIGITSNNYSDGRKRDWLLTRLANDMRLDDFEFQIFGGGWDDVAAQLTVAGAKVTINAQTSDYAADYDAIKAAVPHFDYYFYPGLDEGSMGTLDALAAGVKTIATTQGFHLDIPHALTHGFWDYAELRTIFEQIRGELRDRADTARELTWARYAQRHLEIWRSLLACDELPADDRLSGTAAGSAAPGDGSQGRRMYPLVSYRGILGDRFRREMALRFWIPRSHKAYLDVRRIAGRFARSLLGAAR